MAWMEKAHISLTQAKYDKAYITTSVYLRIRHTGVLILVSILLRRC